VSDSPAAPPPPPPLPARLTDVRWCVGVGTALWLALSIALLVVAAVGARPLDGLFATSVAGWLLGLLGFGIMAWQRAARRRGSRAAQDAP
jgi:hypothetical protein